MSTSGNQDVAIGGNVSNPTDSQPPVVPQGATTSAQGGGVGGASTSQRRRHDSDDSSSDDSDYDDTRSNRSGRHGSRREYYQISFNYNRLNVNTSSGSINLGKPPHFDGVWDTLFINHQGTKRVREGRIRALESELNRFIIKKDETPQEMYNRLNKIVNKIRSLGSDKWGRREVVDKILSAYMARDVQLPILIREKRGFKKFTPTDVIGRIEEHLITVKEFKLSQEMSKIHEQIEKNNGVALKASHKSKEKEASSSSKATTKKIDDDSDSESMDEEEMALFMRRIRRMMKRGGFFEKNKDKEKNKRKSKRSCFGCGKEDHFIANCPNVKIKRNNTSKRDKSKYKKKIGEAHLGQE
ncbi:hypothetical protein SETIT_6G120300v2 [Setaria italica]|uniref:CCHC-type domain-containing protein n=1 Tax=Setaria italica TaxID=4555 RepID=K3YMI8_SETIT|nr:hypothetical protein SETIT_6G120300v2 [Setaria italica]